MVWPVKQTVGSWVQISNDRCHDSVWVEWLSHTHAPIPGTHTLSVYSGITQVVGLSPKQDQHLMESAEPFPFGCVIVSWVRIAESYEWGVCCSCSGHTTSGYHLYPSFSCWCGLTFWFCTSRLCDRCRMCMPLLCHWTCRDYLWDFQYAWEAIKDLH